MAGDGDASSQPCEEKIHAVADRLGLKEQDVHKDDRDADQRQGPAFQRARESDGRTERWHARREDRNGDEAKPQNCQRAIDWPDDNGDAAATAMAKHADGSQNFEQRQLTARNGTLRSARPCWPRVLGVLARSSLGVSG